MYIYVNIFIFLEKLVEHLIVSNIGINKKTNLFLTNEQSKVLSKRKKVKVYYIGVQIFARLPET